MFGCYDRTAVCVKREFVCFRRPARVNRRIGSCGLVGYKIAARARGIPTVERIAYRRSNGDCGKRGIKRIAVIYAQERFVAAAAVIIDDHYILFYRPARGKLGVFRYAHNIARFHFIARGSIPTVERVACFARFGQHAVRIIVRSGIFARNGRAAVGIERESVCFRRPARVNRRILGHGGVTRYLRAARLRRSGKPTDKRISRTRRVCGHRVAYLISADSDKVGRNRAAVTVKRYYVRFVCGCGIPTRIQIYISARSGNTIDYRIGSYSYAVAALGIVPARKRISDLIPPIADRGFRYGREIAVRLTERNAL